MSTPPKGIPVHQGREEVNDKVVITDPAAALTLVGTGAAVLVAGEDAAAVGEAVAALRAAGSDATGWVGDPSDPGVGEMARELYPGAEITTAVGG